MWYYLSFADGDRPKGTQFLGAVIVEGDDIKQAVTAAHLRGINPGGEVISVKVPPQILPPEIYRNTLLQAEDIKDAFEHTGTRTLLQGGASGFLRKV